MSLIKVTLLRQAWMMIEFITIRRVKGMKEFMVVRNQEYPHTEGVIIAESYTYSPSPCNLVLENIRQVDKEAGD